MSAVPVRPAPAHFRAPDRGVHRLPRTGIESAVRRVGLVASLTVALLVVATGVHLPQASAPTQQVQLQAQPPPAVAQRVLPASLTIRGVDLHDGMILQSGTRYYLYGTQYACGFTFLAADTPWCGFGVATSDDLQHWSPITTLFSPKDVSPHSGQSWRRVCGQTGQGCFNPRMIERTGWGTGDGRPILWFNAPRDYSSGSSNAYWAMTCESLAGPCRSPVKPDLSVCTDNGDFSLVLDAPRPPMMFCTMADQSLASERLDGTGMSGSGDGHTNLAGAVKSESPGAYRDPSGTWVLTFNELNCAYCAGAPTSYATADAVDGQFASPPVPRPRRGATPMGRRAVSATSCGGQPRTVVQLDGQPYQFIDLWLGTAAEAKANIQLERLTFLGGATVGEPLKAFEPWRCDGAQDGG